MLFHLCSSKAISKVSKAQYKLYSSPTTIWLIKSRRMTLTGHVARMM